MDGIYAQVCGALCCPHEIDLNHFAQSWSSDIFMPSSSSQQQPPAVSQDICMKDRPLAGKWVFLFEQLLLLLAGWLDDLLNITASIFRFSRDATTITTIQPPVRVLGKPSERERSVRVLNFICINWHTARSETLISHAIVKLGVLKIIAL